MRCQISCQPFSRRPVGARCSFRCEVYRTWLGSGELDPVLATLAEPEPSALIDEEVPPRPHAGMTGESGRLQPDLGPMARERGAAAGATLAVHSDAEVAVAPHADARAGPPVERRACAGPHSVR